MSDEPNQTILSTVGIIIAALLLTVVTDLTIGAQYPRMIANNLTFMVGLGILLRYFAKGLGINLLVLFISSIMFVLISISSSLAGLFLVDRFMFLGQALAYPITSIGYYPPGPDLWFPIGAFIWGISSVIIINLSGALARILPPRVDEY